MVLVSEIRHVKNGYIVLARWPFGPSTTSCGEVVCQTLEEVIALLRRCDEGIDP